MFSYLSTEYQSDLKDFLIQKINEFEHFDNRVFDDIDDIYLLNHIK